MIRLNRIVTVTAFSNETVRHTARLSASKKARDEACAFVAEGRKLIYEAYTNGFKLINLFVLQEACEAYCGMFGEVQGGIYAVTRSIMEKMTESKTPQDITAVFAYKPCAGTPDGSYYLCLEGVQEPGNVGALIRSAAAFGFDGAVLSGGCADIYSPKVLRGSMGASLRLPVYETADMPAFVLDMKRRGFFTYAAALDGDPVSAEDMVYSEKMLVLIGNEGNGLKKETVVVCDGVVKIPMSAGAESLNAAVAGGIIMWEVAKWRKNMRSGSPNV